MPTAYIYTGSQDFKLVGSGGTRPRIGFTAFAMKYIVCA